MMMESQTLGKLDCPFKFMQITFFCASISQLMLVKKGCDFTCPNDQTGVRIEQYMRFGSH